MSGHSKWSTIKRHKGAQDAKRSKIFTKLIKEVTIAARIGGGDPNGNPRLRRAIDAARAQNMPADNLDRAIKKGTGELEGTSYEELTYEGVGPGGALFVLQVMTDNRNRTAPELRKLFDKHGGQLGASGTALWAFDERGVIDLEPQGLSEERVFELAAEAGASDIQHDGAHWTLITEREALDAVRDALEQATLKVAQAELAMLPKTPKEVDGDEAMTLVSLAEALDDHDDVQKVFTDFELSAAALARLEADG